MISIAALLLAAATSQFADDIFTDTFETGYACPASISTPNGTLTRRQISDIVYLPGNAHIRRNVDVMSWNNIWGSISDLGLPLPWPGAPGASPTIKTIGKREFLAAKFHVPADVTGTLNGRFKHVMYGGGPNIDFAISSECGDFDPGEAKCAVTNYQATDGTMVFWRTSPGNSNYCHLQPDRDYYVNIRFTNPNTTGPDCQGTACQTTIQQYIGY